ncbi:MAG: hypothetical protein FGM33_08640 [Candidatus Kapabacteria bacterium]|nr:hypothetical protein [Candidatus Kapabacteria bacterium]
MMNRLPKTLLVAAFFVAACLPSIAQRFDPDSVWNLVPPSDTTFRKLLFLPQYGVGIHQATGLECLEGGNCKPFEGGSGSFMSIAVGMEQKMTEDIDIVGTLGLNIWDASMLITDGSARVRMPDGSVANMVRELTMNANGMALGLIVGAKYNLGALSFVLGPNIEFALGPKWSQDGRILEPSGVRYPNGLSSTTIVPEQAISNAATLRFGLATTVGYDVAVTDKISIAPSVSFHFMPTAIRSGSSWSDMRVMGGIAVRYESNAVPDTVERVREYRSIDTVIANRQGDRNATFVVAGVSTTTTDTARKGLLHQITSRMRRTDTLLTLELNYDERVAEERRVEQVKLETARRREAESRAAQVRAAAAKAAEERRPKVMINVGGKKMALRAKPKIRKKDANGNETDEFYEETYYINEDGDTVDLLNRDIAEELQIRLTSEKQELTFMVLPSVFFDSAMSTVPRRYRQLSSTEGYAPGANMADQHLVNLDILNIFAHRIKNGNVSMIVRGYSDETSEGASCAIARARAQSVVDYFTGVWKIDPSRIKVEIGSGNCAPNPASSGATARGRQENRRVEFFTDDYEYFKPVQDQKVLVKPEWDFTAANITISDEQDPIVSWMTSFRQGKRVFKVNRGDGVFTNTAIALDDSTLRTLNPENVIVSMKVFTQSGDSMETDMEIPVGQFKKDIKFSSLSLAMFSVRSTELGKRDQELLKTFASRLDAGDRVAVIGYADDLGDAAMNQQLSLGRAKTVADRLRVLRPDCIVTRVEGMGSNSFPIGVSSYDTPEQRFMSRTVQIVLEKN